MKKHPRFSPLIMRLVAALLSAGIVVAALVSYAWFYGRRGVYTLTEVSEPFKLAIKGGNKTEIEQLDLSQIDLSNSQYQANFVFCVTGSSADKYVLELAHTTNISFTYTLYKTTQLTARPGNDTVIVYNDPISQTPYYYAKTAANKVTGMVYINQDGTTQLANSTQHTNTYGTIGSEKVQKNAEPLYLLSPALTPGSITAGEKEYADYYILELSWSESIATSNPKETDLVYLMAENVAS